MRRRKVKKKVDKFYRLGMGVSVVGHLFFFIAIAFANYIPSGAFKKPIVYSVTIESGKSLGGISQEPKNKNARLAPPKKVKEKKAEPKKEKVKVPQKKVEKKKEPPKKEEKKEVVVPKKEEKPKPTPTPKATPEPKKPEPKKEETKKELSETDIDKRLQEAVQRYTGESTDAGGTGFGAGRLGGEGMGGGVQQSPEFFQYKRLLETHIKSGWRWYDPNAQLQAQVEFSLSIDGEIGEVQLSSSSGIKEYDQSVLRAVKKANPAPAPPASVYEFFRNVRITFEPGD